MTRPIRGVIRTDVSQRVPLHPFRSLRIVSVMKADGPRIRQRRETSGQGLRRFAEAAGISASHLSRIERGETDPQPEALARIATTFGCDIDDLVPETNGDEDGPHDHGRAGLPQDEGSRGSHP
ncbi:helix-turn-helix domain-containing protein [Streptomyces clavifer]|uniref:helix-turn-helix domain-containing protein n=1 Tax=Streptomyces clavifer TaxID=68188 RepID=UPI00352C5EC0